VRDGSCRPADGCKQLLYPKTRPLSQNDQRAAGKKMQMAWRIQVNPVTLEESMPEARDVGRDND
jgi:hypothetical protein